MVQKLKDSWGQGFVGEESGKHFHIYIQKVFETIKYITMYKTHRRSQFKVGNKSKMKHDLKIVLIASRKKPKEALMLYVLQSLNTIEMKILFSEI